MAIVCEKSVDLIKRSFICFVCTQHNLKFAVKRFKHYRIRRYRGWIGHKAKLVRQNEGYAFRIKTVKGSLTVKFRSRSNSRVRIEVGTEREGFTEVADIRSPSFDFGDTDFEGLSFSNDDTLTLVIKDGSKKWVRKSVTVYSDDYASPFSLESLIYRFRIKGKIKY